MSIEVISEPDRAAMQLAIDLTLANEPHDPATVEQVNDFLNGYANEPPRPWREVGVHCSYHQQMRRLKLKPNVEPPCEIITSQRAKSILRSGDSYEPSRGSAQLLLDMLDAGVSAYHPDPFTAIAEAKRRA
jgi:hypothetical protein